MSNRLKKFRELLDGQHLDAYLVTKDANIRYLTGFDSSESWLFITGQRVFYITDFRYILEAKKFLRSISVVRYRKSIFDEVRELSKASRVKKIGFDDRFLPLSAYRKLAKSLKGTASLKALGGVIEILREVKDPQEVSMIRKALKVHAQTLLFLKKVIKPGKSERDIFRQLENFVKDRGAGFSFPPIIASGPNSCFPHARVSDRIIRNNEIVLVDTGIDINGYKSDLTRIFFLGKIPPLVLKVNEHVRTAQLKAIAKIRPNIKAGDIDYQARNYLEKNKLGKYFGHSLGHGVGLEIHENPSLSPRSQAILREGMIITVEPAVYLPNKFGIRIEDMALVTDSGYEILSRDIP